MLNFHMSSSVDDVRGTIIGGATYGGRIKSAAESYNLTSVIKAGLPITASGFNQLIDKINASCQTWYNKFNNSLYVTHSY